MAQEALLDRHLQDGEELLRRLQVAQFDVSAASWVRDDEGGLWSLYVASKNVDEQGLREAYGQCGKVLRAASDLCIEPFDVKLMSPAHPMAKEIIKLNEPYPVKVYTRHRLREMGGMRMGEAHIYPPLTTA